MNANGITLLRETCEHRWVDEVVGEALRENLAIGIGSFPHGDFEEDTLRHASECYSIYREPLATWIVTSRIIGSAERILGIME